MIRRLLLFAAAVGILVATTASPAQAVASTIDPMWMTNGTLYSQTQVGNVMYVGGKKVTMVRSTPNGTPGPHFSVGNLAAFDVTTGEGIDSFHPMVTHATDVAFVHAVDASPDGHYLYIGGHFDAVDGVPVQNVARIDLSTGTVDSSFAPKVNATGKVYAILVNGDGSRIYLGGTFGQIDGTSVKKIAAVNEDGSLATAWNPKANKPVRALTFSADATKVFIGGLFTTINGQTRESVALVDASTGALDPWAIPTGSTLGVGQPQIAWSLVATSTRLYGGFGHGPNFAAAFRLDNGNTGTRLWRFNTVGNVEKVLLSPDGLSVYAGGHFGTGRLQQSVCGGSQNLHGLMRLNAATGDQDCSWLPQLAPYGNNFNGAWDLDFTASHLFVAGGFSSVNGTPAQNIARFKL
jgi:hypothetical protein